MYNSIGPQRYLNVFTWLFDVKSFNKKELTNGSAYFCNMQSEWFKDWFNTSYYHLLYSHRDETEANKFINNLLNHLQPSQSSKMLDLACGRGRHARFLAQHGFEVTGVDLSEASIAFAKSHSEENPEFFVQDMRIPCRILYFNYVFSFFTSFGYFKNMRNNDKVLEAVNKSLVLGGTYVLDYLNVSLALKNIHTTQVIEESGILFETRKLENRMVVASIHRVIARP